MAQKIIARGGGVLVAQLCLTVWDPVDCILPGSVSMGFSRQVYRSGLPSPPPGDLPDPGIEPWSPHLQAGSSPPEPPGKPLGLLVLEEGHCYARRPLEQVWRGARDSLQPHPDLRDAS